MEGMGDHVTIVKSGGRATVSAIIESFKGGLSSSKPPQKRFKAFIKGQLSRLNCTKKN